MACVSIRRGTTSGCIPDRARTGRFFIRHGAFFDGGNDEAGELVVFGFLLNSPIRFIAMATCAWFIRLRERKYCVPSFSFLTA